MPNNETTQSHNRKVHQLEFSLLTFSKLNNQYITQRRSKHTITTIPIPKLYFTQLTYLSESVCPSVQSVLPNLADF